MNTLTEVGRWLTDPENWTGGGGIGDRLVEHLGVSAMAVAIAFLLAFPVGVIVGHSRRGAGVVAGSVGAMRAIPSIGIITLFGLLIGIGLVAPVIALVLLAIPSLLAGTYAGIEAVDPATVDAARAVGMTERQIVTKVELPLAAPVIIGGLRSAVLQVVSTTTLAAYTADVGLGRILFTGLKSNNYVLTLSAAILVIALAVLIELILAWGNKRAARSVRKV
ncbi:ABC transporter permease [Corynebacterium doosanense]|uniref:ABC transporter permease n=1 Tax=Corynebacterium doosanense CAU 212 = DSM 45436 TaxID=558173 RepID=A0A097IES0_9CORY|nr:ABC transporter permease [Corynebacterium doosanense]AIT60642.1 ABC transporter permease [Corynebacterium doosanense CAU 212 = DSM 45436]